MVNLIEREYSFSATEEREIVRIATETLCTVFRLRHRAQFHRGAHPQRFVRLCRVDSRRDHVQNFIGVHEEGIDGVGSIYNEIKVVAPTRYGLEDLFGMDWRICPLYEHPDGNIITVATNISVARNCFPANCHWHGRQRVPRLFFPLLDEL